MKILTFTTLYPDASRPAHGIFVENRLRRLISHGKVQSRVVAPVPWFPGKSAAWGSYAKYARVPTFEVRHGIEIEHPRYPLIPKVGMTVAPWLMAVALKRRISKVIEQGYDFDVIDAHYFYPDGVAAIILGKSLGKPVVITARGTDINLISEYCLPRRMIQWAARRAAGLITVCQALKDRLTQLGIDDKKIMVLRNGVDLELFKPSLDRTAVGCRLAAGEKMLLSVGALVPLKGHDLVIRALASLPGYKLFIAGEGPGHEDLQQLAASLSLTERVVFLGRVGHEELPRYYGAANALVLASSREGWPNVLLEALACGTPVVATSIGGIPEIITKPEAGVLVRERTADAVAAGLIELFSACPDRSATRRFAEQFSWDDTTAGQERLFASVVAMNRTSTHAGSSGQSLTRQGRTHAHEKDA
jgi:teichuronic acid biosynthesis glycosyltransferase TuaC